MKRLWTIIGAADVARRLTRAQSLIEAGKMQPIQNLKKSPPSIQYFNWKRVKPFQMRLITNRANR